MKRTYYIQALLLGAILVIVNLLINGSVLRYDLTKDGRYTLSDVSISTVDSLKKVMTIKVYLDGDELPAEAKRFRDAVRTMLDELKEHAGDRLNVQFIDPSNNKALQKHLAQMGAPAIPITEKKNEAQIQQQWIFPAAVINYDGNEEVVNLLFGDCVQGQGGVFKCYYDKAEGELEYKLISHMQRTMPGQRRMIGIIQSHGCMPLQNMAEWISELQKFYEVIKIDLSKRDKLLPVSPYVLPDSVKARLEKDALGYDLLIVAKPAAEFSNRDKYILDQFIMMGGRVLWLVDQEEVDELDFSKPDLPATLSIIRHLNLDDLFFKYGFRIGTNLIEAAPHPSIAGPIEIRKIMPGAEGERGLRPAPATYPFYPLVLKPWMRDHEITRGVEAVKLRYASTIDTIAVPDVKFYPLLFTSPYTRKREGSFMIDLQRAINDRPPKELYKNKGSLLTGLALEGRFTSVFNSRKIPDSLRTVAPTINNTVQTNRMAVFSDGDLPGKSRMRYTSDGRIPAHNKQLLMNAVDWLMNDKTFNQIRAKEITSPLLDEEKIAGNEWWLQSLNIAAPILLIILFGVVRYYRRRSINRALKHEQ